MQSGRRSRFRLPVEGLLGDDREMSDRRRIYDDRLYAHFVTFSCDQRRRFLDMDHPKRLLLGQLNVELTHSEARCVGFVIMPDHVHAVIWLAKTGCLSQFLQRWKRGSSNAIQKWFHDHEIAYVKDHPVEGRIWIPKYYAFQIESTSKLEEKLDYMHMNPVRAGLVSRASDWKWSSARWYENGRSVGVPIKWVD